jgi:pyruvate dehydrogenase E2 component (dihydrolipoamide acetyltransferase)
MAISVVMPALELTQETGKLVSWRRNEGERVTKGEPLLEIETDKAVVEIEAPADGVLAGVQAHAGDVIAVGKTIAWIVSQGEQPPPEEAASGSDSRGAAQAVRAAQAPTDAAEQPAQRGAKISPKARRLATERGVDISRLRGTGAEGEILASDVLAFSELKTADRATELETLGSVGRLMAERTTQSWTTVPHFFVARDVTAAALIEAREKLGPEIQTARGVRLTHTDLLVALVARTLVKHPRIYASWTNQGIRLNQEVNIGVAMAVKEGVVAAVIHGANSADLGEIAVQRRDLSERAKAGRLRPPDIAGATFTISNLGMHHVDAFTAIITPPQVAVLAVGTISDRVVPVDGKPGIEPMITLTLSSDHRVIDGVRAASFLDDVATAISAPSKYLG